MASKSLLSESSGSSLLLGNEAIARGVLESGVQVVAAYPGTPSSEIVDTLARVAREAGIHVEWSTNEKVAFECAAGAAFLGVRSFTAMKSVGLNVAMDTLMVVTLTGVQGGFVFLVADDPQCWSTQNEQDSRGLAASAEVPCLEPSTPQEAKEMVAYAYDLSERLGRAVMIRTVTRLNHSRSKVELGPIKKKDVQPRYYRQRAGFPALPKHRALHAEEQSWAKELLGCPFNEYTHGNGAEIAVIASGNAVNYAREAIATLRKEGRISLLKIGVLNPFPVELAKEVLSTHSTIVVLEEIEPYIENQLRSLCYTLPTKPRIIGKKSGDIEIPGELTLEKSIRVLRAAEGRQTTLEGCSTRKFDELLLERNTVLCAGCPHAGVFYAIARACRKQKKRALISGDIGCYGLGVFPPYNLFDSHICMGASIGIANGYAATGYDGPILCVIGDSTFYHSGVSALVNAVFNKHDITVVILDNYIIGMTGHQADPGTGVTAMGETTKKLSVEEMVRACGVEFVEIVDAFDVKKVVSTVQKALAFKGPSVIVTKGDCAIVSGRRKTPGKKEWFIDSVTCDGCGVCANLLYCPALRKGEEQYEIDKGLCTNCGVCAQICPKGSIQSKEVNS